jgi:hypothetical protein
MADPTGTEPAKTVASLVGASAAFALDAVIVYILALRVSATLVSLWFAWAPRLFQISTIVRPGDWYLQHLEVMTIVPALVAGYVDVGRIVPALLGGLIKGRRIASPAIWAWSIPTLVLIYKMLQYRAPSSVLIGTSMSAFRYFFDILRNPAPTLADLLASDPLRRLAQMTITAPFYAGIAYSMGAIFYRHRVLNRIFSFERREETLPTDADGETTPASRSSSPD